MKKNRKRGENPSPICSLIRGDRIERFVTFTNENNIPLNYTLTPSEFETNFMLLQKDRISLVEYAAFNGSIEIFKYLIKYIDIKKPKRLAKFAIHGNCSEIITMLEEKYGVDYNFELLNISIMCHTNDITNYILDNIDIENSVSSKIACNYGINAYNFAFITENAMWDKDNISIFSINDYYNCVSYLLSNCDIDLATTIKQIEKKTKKTNDSIKLVLRHYKENGINI